MGFAVAAASGKWEQTKKAMKNESTLNGVTNWE